MGFPSPQSRRERIHKSIIKSFWGRKNKQKREIHMSITWHWHGTEISLETKREKEMNVIKAEASTRLCFSFSFLLSNRDNVIPRGKAAFVVSGSKVLDPKTVGTQCSRRDVCGFLVLNRPLQVKRHSGWNTQLWNEMHTPSLPTGGAPRVGGRPPGTFWQLAGKEAWARWDRYKGSDSSEWARPSWGKATRLL